MTRAKEKLIMYSCKFKRTNLMKSATKAYKRLSRFYKKL